VEAHTGALGVGDGLDAGGMNVDEVSFVADVYEIADGVADAGHSIRRFV
jgi:hypothetical protein